MIWGEIYHGREIISGKSSVDESLAGEAKKVEKTLDDDDRRNCMVRYHFHGNSTVKHYHQVMDL